MATKVFTLDPSTSGNNPEGVAWDNRSESCFVGTLGTGTIYRATLRDAKLRPFITPDPAPADSAVGMKVGGGKLFVAGQATGSIYAIATRALGSFETSAGGLLNHLVLAEKGDVYVTDSFRPMLHLTPMMIRAGSRTPESVNVGPEIADTANQFNLNGIVSRNGGREPIVVNTFSKSLFRIGIDPAKTSARKIMKIHAPSWRVTAC